MSTFVFPLLQPKPKKTATVPSASSVKTEKAAPKPRPRPTPTGSEFGRKLTRASTVSKTVETVKRQRERALKAKRLLKKKLSLKSSANNTRPLTQEELLEEAKRRDHRRLGRELELFTIEEEAGPARSTLWPDHAPGEDTYLGYDIPTPMGGLAEAGPVEVHAVRSII